MELFEAMQQERDEQAFFSKLTLNQQSTLQDHIQQVENEKKSTAFEEVMADIEVILESGDKFTANRRNYRHEMSHRISSLKSAIYLNSNGAVDEK
jgi:hydroxyacyl-ACP dehydratase HTD2-like protein with hotdog domain